MLFHLSIDPAITRFEPRASAYTGMPVVWAVSASHMANYLLPRECPRICIRAAPDSTAGDVEALLGGDRAVIAIEAAWLERVRRQQLYGYAMPPDSFSLLDANAGYWVSRTAVTPMSSLVLHDLPGEIARRDTALRVLASLWDLHAAVKVSSLAFSMIRMRNAAPPP